MSIYLGRWRWLTAPYPHWAPPADAIASVDLRTTAQCAQVGGTPAGWGLFELPGPDQSRVGLRIVGADMEDRPGAALRDDIRTRLNLPADVPVGTLGDIVWNVLTAQRCPVGVARCRGLMPTTRRHLELHLGAWSARKAFGVGGVEEWPGVQAQIHADYKRLRAAVLAGTLPDGHHRRVLDYWCQKYRTQDFRQFIPADEPVEEPLPHATTITESFNKADSDTLGPDLTWTEIADIDVISNAAVAIATGVLSARAESDLSSDDHYAQVTVTTLGGDALAGAAARFAAGANTLYKTGPYSSDGKQYLQKVIAGTDSTITSVAITRSIPEPYKIECDGSTIKCYQNGVERINTTDTSITGNLRCGIAFYQSGSLAGAVDDFEAADLAVGGATGYLNLPLMGVGD